VNIYDIKDGEEIGVPKGYKDGFVKGYKQGIIKGDRRFKQGTLRSMRKAIHKVGAKRFGPIPEPLAAKLEAIKDQAKLDKLLIKILIAESWDQLLGRRKRK
jgi:hypothetical protein